MTEPRTELGLEIEAGLREAIAHRRGQLALPIRVIEPMPATLVKEIRRRHSKNTREFEQRFGIPARTVEGWEQGRKIDVAGRVLLTTIDLEPAAVERAVRAAKRQQAVKSA